MEFISSDQKEKTIRNADSIVLQEESFEVAVVEDNKLVNLILSKELDSTIHKIMNTKNHPIKFTSFYFGVDFLNYLENKDFSTSRLILFSDFYLEDDMNGAKILQRIKQKGIDATVIIMSDTTNRQTSIDTINMGAHQFVPKDENAPLICSQILYKMVN
jgi:DNA-binding NtrC family response regulator